MAGFLGKLIKGAIGLIPGVGPIAGTALEMLGAAGKLGKNTPVQMQSQLTPEQKLILQARRKQLQAKADDPTALNYVRKAGGIYDQSMGM